MLKWLKQLFCDHEWRQEGSSERYVSIMSIFAQSNDVPSKTVTYYCCPKCWKRRKTESYYDGWQGKY